MNIEDFVYPRTAGHVTHASHAQFLEAGALRYAIHAALNNLSVDELKYVLSMIQAETSLTHSGEK